MQSRRSKWPLWMILLVGLTVAGVAMTPVSTWIEAAFTARLSEKATSKTTPVAQVKLAVPLINQLAAPQLYNGCEVTSLAMMLNDAHIKVTKNELAAQLPQVPLTYANGERGNPNTGFVGDVTGNQPGLGVYHGPIYRLAKAQTPHVRDLTGASFDQVIQQLIKGRPVWTITTQNFAPVDQLQTWQTPTGPVKVTYAMHSVVIVGFNRSKKLIYINNPYGQRQQAVNWTNFEAAYRQMGRQAIVLTVKS